MLNVKTFADVLFIVNVFHISSARESRVDGSEPVSKLSSNQAADQCVAAGREAIKAHAACVKSGVSHHGMDKKQKGRPSLM